MLLSVAAVIVWRVLRARAAGRARREPFPTEWRELLESRVPLYRRMPSSLRFALELPVRAFLERIDFVGCNGLEVTDEMRLTVAVQACLLVAGRNDGAAYDSLYSVLLYPDEFVVADSEEDEAGVVTEGERALSGQSLDTARIVLSWRDVQDSSDDYNVVLHEFAHYLDHSFDSAISAPLRARRRLAAWHRVLEREYDALCAAAERGEDTVIDPYGAEEPAEFFAVATEAFFGKPRELEARHSELYGVLRTFYALDPARW